MWTRHEARPTPYNGIEFRSALEATVACELDRMGVEWAYEAGVDGVNYLPDFTILYAPDELDLPHWLEVKPAELLYAVRDHFGAPERFNDNLTFWCSSEDLRSAGLEEIWKPKKLAEHAGAEVLVVNKIARNRSLSISMWPEMIELSRSHPCVNHRQIEQERQRQEEWERRSADHQAALERARAARAAEVLEMAKRFGRPAKFSGWCQTCGVQQPAQALVIVRMDERWRSVCKAHLR